LLREGPRTLLPAAAEAVDEVEIRELWRGPDVVGAPNKADVQRVVGPEVTDLLPARHRSRVCWHVLGVDQAQVDLFTVPSSFVVMTRRYRMERQDAGNTAGAAAVEHEGPRIRKLLRRGVDVERAVHLAEIVGVVAGKAAEFALQLSVRGHAGARDDGL